MDLKDEVVAEVEKVEEEVVAEADKVEAEVAAEVTHVEEEVKAEVIEDVKAVEELVGHVQHPTTHTGPPW